MEIEELSPQEYFDTIKDKKNHITDDELIGIYDNCLELLNKYKITGQIKGMKKLLFHLNCIEKERDIVHIGIDTFVYRDDIEEYIDSVAKNTVKIIEIENYEREIPDEIVTIVSKVKDKFDKLYVLFTDYTGKIERQVAREHRSRDPILFGTFQNEQTRTVIDRFYYLGDWEDEYCDLTLDKMVNEIKTAKKKDIVYTIKTPEDINELKEQLSEIENVNESYRHVNNKKKSFFSKIKVAFKMLQ